MDLEQRLRASLVAPDPGPTFTTRVMARVGRGVARRRSSFIVIGAVLVVGAAAAMLAWQMSAVRPPVESAAISTLPVQESVAEEPDLQATLEVNEPVAAALSPATSRDISSRYSVQVMPLRQEEQDAHKRGLVEALYAATLDELRKVPGLMLRVSDDSVRESGGQADYVLTITSLATRVQQSGDLGSAVWVEMTLESGQSAASRRTLPVGGNGTIAIQGSGAMAGEVNLVLNNRLSGFSIDMDYGPDEAGDVGPRATPAQLATAQVKVLRLQLFAQDAAFQQRCNTPNPVRPAQCMTPAQQAANQVEVMRLEVFPPDAAFQRYVVARLGDNSRDQAEEFDALQLLQSLVGENGSRLDAGTIQAIARYATGRSALMRTAIWSRMRQVSHPALAAPLVESLRHDADQQVRLAALTNLEANFSADPGVRSAFESIGRVDPDSTVRVAVRRALYGEAQWRDEVLAGLNNTALPYEARLAPLLASEPAVSPRQQGYRRGALREQQVLRPLIAVIRENLRESDHAKATREALGLLVSVDDPAVFDLFMQVLRETPALKQETSMQGNVMNLSGPVSSWVFNHRNDPLVLQSVSNVDPRLRTMMDMMEQSREVASSAVPLVPVDLAIIPSNLIQRMREVTDKPAPPAPITQ